MKIGTRVVTSEECSHWTPRQIAEAVLCDIFDTADECKDAPSVEREMELVAAFLNGLHEHGITLQYVDVTEDGVTPVASQEGTKSADAAISS